MSIAEDVSRKRPGWVWIISIFFILSVGWTLFSFYQISSGRLPMNAEQTAYFDNLSPLDYASSVGLGLVNLFAAFSLLFLRKIAFYLFTGGLIANIMMCLWHISTKGWVAAIGGSGIIGSAIGLCIIVAVCRYSWRLIQRGILR